MPNVLNTSRYGDQGPHFELLRSAGFGVDVVTRDVDLFVEDNLISVLAGYQAVVAGVEPYTRRVLEGLPELRVIARSGVGFDAIDLDACDDAGAVVVTTPGVNHDAVAEHTIAMLLALACWLPEADRNVRSGEWKRMCRRRVSGSTLGIVGLGRIGRATAARAIPLGLTVLAAEPQPDREFVARWDIELTDSDDLLRRSDYVSLHAPSTPQTYHLMNAAAFSKMKQGAVLINTARGPLVDETALCQALRSGRLRGAGLDVFESEPLPLDSPLLGMENVLLSGHLAGLDDISIHDTFTMVAKTIIELYNGGWPAECIQNLSGVSDWTWHRPRSGGAEPV